MTVIWFIFLKIGRKWNYPLRFPHFYSARHISKLCCEISVRKVFASNEKTLSRVISLKVWRYILHMSNDIISAYTVPFFERELILYEVLGMLDLIIFFKILAEVEENRFFFSTYLISLAPLKCGACGHWLFFYKICQYSSRYIPTQLHSSTFLIKR